MKILIVTTPIIRFLIDKYLPNLPQNVQNMDIIAKFNNHEILGPNEVKFFIQLLTELQKYLFINNYFNRIVAILKLVGDSRHWKGILNLLFEQHHEAYVVLYEPHSLSLMVSQLDKLFNHNLDDVRIIAPLNLDETDEIIEQFHTGVKLPIYPLIFNFLTSKWLLNFTFSPYTPRTFYFPDNTSANDYLTNIQNIANKENIKYVILKDEYDTDIRSVVPYMVTPITKLEQSLNNFYLKSKGINNLGGLVIEEFLTSNHSINIYRTHIFGKIITGGTLHYKILLKSYSEGALLDSIVEKLVRLPTDLTTHQSDLLNPILSRFYPFLFSSIDFIIYNNQIHLIDVNGVTSSFNYIQKPEQLDLDKLFSYFINAIQLEKNEVNWAKQITYQRAIQNLYQTVRKLGPCYINGDKILSIKDGAEDSVQRILKDGFKDPTENLNISAQFNNHLSNSASKN